MLQSTGRGWNPMTHIRGLGLTAMMLPHLAFGSPINTSEGGGDYGNSNGARTTCGQALAITR